ncbi:DUF4349 domain-containing protein [Agrococcus sp. SGAir0287]|uniref:DUF4349 domain-containing protein n=1 Tax=Agrococcus sp. SGAir0287 TaxID=2070347 RepID=UPI0010CD0284|nr:DUF4349 domain-containing protein [Agrococcus sp. SGAir0287]QCR19857.1 DUF4349 domain-containing protein [Agrococcus sp. SGAir0287]
MRLLAPLAAVAALLLAGCAAPLGGASAESAPQPAPAQPAPDVAGGDGQGASQPSAAHADEAVIVTGWVQLVAEAPAEAADAAAALAEDAGGSVSSRSESAGSGDVPERAELTLRVPADAVDALLDDLRDVGDVRDVDVTSVDVSQEVLDLDVRVASARASVDRLTALLATAADTATLLEIEGQLTTRTSELESLLAQQSALADQVALSTITVSIASVAVAPEEPPATFVDGLLTGWSALAATASGAAVVAGAALPWIVALAIPVAVVVLVVRARRRTSAPSPSAPPPGDDAARLA